MKKFLFILFATALSLSLNAQLLYRISGNGLTRDSYVIGTYHLADGSFVDSIPGACQILADVDQVCGELAMTNMLHPDSLAILMEKMYLPEGQTLKDVLTDEQFYRLDSLYENLTGYKLSNPLIFSQAGRMSPSSLNTSLQLLICLSKEKRTIDVQNTLDNYFQKVALESGKSVLGLETMSFQAEVLLGSPIDRQVQQLMCTVDNIEAGAAMMGDIVDAFYSQNLEQLTAAMLREMGNECDSTPEEYDILLYNRNANWIKLMPGIMENNSTLFAVGAGHLGGEKGLLNLLRKVGYSVTGVE